MQDEDKPKPKRQRRTKSAPSELPAVEGAEGEPVKKKRRPKGPDPDAFSEPVLSAMTLLCSPTTLSHCTPMHVIPQNTCTMMHDSWHTDDSCIIYLHGVRNVMTMPPDKVMTVAVLPAREVLEIAQANPPGPRPVPNLG